MKQVWLKAAKKQKAWTLGLCVAVCLLIIGGYGFGSYKVWSELDQSVSVGLRSIKSKTDEAISKPTVSTADKVKKQQALVDLLTTFENYDKRCEPGVLFKWQQIINPQFKELMKKCNTNSSSLKNLRKATLNIINYLKNEKEITAILATKTTGVAAIGDTEWATQLQNWTTIEKELQSAIVEETFENSKKTALEKAGNIKTAWEAMIAANAAKDRKAYEAAVVALAQAYEALGQITQVIQADFAPLAMKFTSTYDHAFQKL